MKRLSTAMPAMLRQVAWVAAVSATFTACGKKANDDTAQSSGGSVASTPQPATIQVADVQLGRALGSDKKVASDMTTFSPKDTIFASVHTTGTTPSATLAARWTFQDGQVVDDRSETITPNGDAHTEFHISKPSGWPPGNYTLHVLLNGQEVQTKNFIVKK